MIGAEIVDRGDGGDRRVGRRMRGPWIATLVVIGVTAATAGRAEPIACLSGAAQTVWVERVVAEDEVDLVDGRRVKLSGVAAARIPLAARGATWREVGRATATTARRQLADLVEGRELAFHDLGEDRHGRRRGHLVDTESGHWIEADLVRAGAVRVDSGGERGRCPRDLAVIEAEARTARRGLWGTELLGVRTALDPRLGETTGTTVVVEGRVRSVGRSGGRTYLNFGDDFRRDFAVVLDDNHRTALAAAGFDPDRAWARDVRVRGIVVRRDGLRIELAAPEDIEWAKR